MELASAGAEPEWGGVNSSSGLKTLVVVPYGKKDRGDPRTFEVGAVYVLEAAA